MTLELEKIGRGKKYRIDLDNLGSGSYISPDILEDVVGLKRNEARYGLALMNIKSFLVEAFGNRAFVKQDRHGLRILDDEDGSAYCEEKIAQFERKREYYHLFALRAINRDNLSPGRRSAYDRFMEVLARKLLAEKKAEIQERGDFPD